MNEIYLGRKDGSQTRHSIDELQTMRSSGRLDPTWLYWTEGMSEWRPLSEWLATNPPEPRLANFQTDSEEENESENSEKPSLPTARRFTLRKDPRELALVLQALFVFELLFDSGRLWLSLWKYRILRMPIDEQLAGNFAYNLSQGVILLGVLVVSTPTLIIFCIWIYRTKSNVFGFGAEGLKISPGWAVGWFFVPIFNLFRPWESLSEAWKASRNPLGWRQERAAPVLHWWWGLSVASIVLSQVIFHFEAAAIDGKQAGEPIQQLLIYSNLATIARDLVGIALCILAFFVVRGLTRAQVELAESPVEPAPNVARLPRST